MKRRFRQLKRQGWHVVVVPRQNLWQLNNMSNNSWGNEEHYKMLREWCHENIAKGEWEGTLCSDSGTVRPGSKRFCFKDPEAKLLFALRWGYQ